MIPLGEFKTLLSDGAIEITTEQDKKTIFKTILYVDGDCDFYVHRSKWNAQLAQTHQKRVQRKQQSLSRHASNVQMAMRHGAGIVSIGSFATLATQLEQLMHMGLLMAATWAGYAALTKTVQHWCKSKFGQFTRSNA
jgi:thiosulfate reductase cytochrome b subunit